MNTAQNTDEEKIPSKMLQWLARIFGTSFVFATLILLFADVMEFEIIRKPHSDNPWDFMMILTAVCFFTGLAGLLLALWKEKTGAIVSFLGMLFFLLLVILNHKAKFSIWLFIFMLPSLLYITHRLILRKKKANLLR